MKVEVGKLDTNKLVNFPRGLNNLKTKVDDLHVDKLKKNFERLEKIKWSSESKSSEKDNVQQTEFESK